MTGPLFEEYRCTPDTAEADIVEGNKFCSKCPDRRAAVISTPLFAKCGVVRGYDDDDTLAMARHTPHINAPQP